MTISLDAQQITMTCPQCGKQLKDTLGRLKRHKRVTCPQCGPIAVDTTQVQRIERDISQQLAKIGGKIGIKF